VIGIWRSDIFSQQGHKLTQKGVQGGGCEAAVDYKELTDGGIDNTKGGTAHIAATV
jgi:hypothetical protein